MNLLHAIRPFVWKRSERASVGRRSKGTTDDEYNQLEVQIGRLRLEVGQEGHLNPENGTNSITERVEMINNDLADIICGDQPVEFTPVAPSWAAQRERRPLPACPPPSPGWVAGCPRARRYHLAGFRPSGALPTVSPSLDGGGEPVLSRLGVADAL